MLKIQRASAGSGKTYALTGTFLTFFLTIPRTPHLIPDPVAKEIPRRLRTSNELSDSLQHILAVTFTNKATAEMKSRIVDKLSALAGADISLPKKGWPDYMDFLTNLTSSSPEDVRNTARQALKILLMDFSSFNVSTIDSFFQTVLRTFAYESDLNDSYQLELDDKFTSNVGVDETLDSVVSGAADTQTSRWLHFLMDESLKEGKGWNPFQRKFTRNGVYFKLINNASKMQSEDFKGIRSQLTNFFNSTPDFYESFEKIDELINKPIYNALKNFKSAARQLKKGFAENNLSLSEDGCAYLASRIEKTLNYSNPFAKLPFEMRSKPSSVFKKGKAPKDEIIAQDLEILLEDWYLALTTLVALKEQPNVRLWNIYRHLLPYVPLLNTIGNNTRLYLEQSNTMQLSDTNTLLYRIIGNCDAPFIYERLGTRLHHFLIDEFQDTSRLQWRNFYPLLNESNSRQYENLIIGDAKQSIYRFRNADPSLITSVVPSNFPDHIPAGYSKAENTNWRSERNIVQFNNLFFHTLSRNLGMGLDKLYSNVIQYPNKKGDRGFVKFQFYRNQQSQLPEHIVNAGKLVNDLLQRGYRQKEIAFLTIRTEESEQIVNALMEYNSSLGEGEKRIEFISDQSLLIGSAQSVKVILASLETIARGYHPKVNTGEEARNKGAARWNDISTKFSYLAARYPEKSSEEIVKLILDNQADDNLLSDLLHSMQSVALPSLVEALTEALVNENLRASEVAFIAAFQDAVLKYCESNPADIASFLDWWHTKGSILSINSPEDMDAVKIMTIHKSKGLEFDCVIIPVANMLFTPSPHKVEWAWVKPDPQFSGTPLLPPFIPVEITDSLAETPHAELWNKLNYDVAMDSLNQSYVAFTRAVKELYVYSPVTLNSSNKNRSKKEVEENKDREPSEVPVKNDNKLGVKALDIFKNWDSEITDARNSMNDISEEIPDKPLNVEYLNSSDNQDYLPCFTFGTPFSAEDIARAREEKELKMNETGENIPPAIINNYHVNSNRGILKIRESDSEFLDNDDEEDPRSEGNILHLIMSKVRTPDTLHQAVEKVRLSGLINHQKAVEIESTLSKALSSVKERGWFDPTNRVLSERWTLQQGAERLRPDRVEIDRDGNATIIDYKFGEKTDVSKYRKQVRGYMQRLKGTGNFRTVRGFLWYVSRSHIEEISL